MKVHVANLTSLVTEPDLMQLFAQHGTVQSVKIVGQSSTGRSFGFVVMERSIEAKAAIAALNGSPMGGQIIGVQEVRRREPASRSQGFGPGRSNGSSGRFGATIGATSLTNASSKVD